MRHTQITLEQVEQETTNLNIKRIFQAQLTEALVDLLLRQLVEVVEITFDGHDLQHCEQDSQDDHDGEHRAGQSFQRILDHYINPLISTGFARGFLKFNGLRPCPAPAGQGRL